VVLKANFTHGDGVMFDGWTCYFIETEFRDGIATTTTPALFFLPKTTKSSKERIIII
jgi:phage terminase large subunit GpA-like protein